MTANKFWMACPFLLMPGLLLAAATTSETPAADISISISRDPSGLIALQAKQAPLHQVLDEIGSKTGTRVHYTVLPRALVTATCAGTSLKQVMDCLLGRSADLMYRYPAGQSEADPNARAMDLWVMGSRIDTAQCAAAKPTSKPDTEAALNEALGLFGKAAKPLDAAKLTQMANAEDPAQRADAMARLAGDQHLDPETARTLLDKGMSDEDPGVRAQAVWGFARRGGADAGAMLQAALQDRDPAVRIMALDAAGNDAQGRALLRQALTDADESVRAYAAAKLNPPPGDLDRPR